MGSYDPKKYEQAKQEAINFFEKNKIIASAALGPIHLNSDGFRHLIFKGDDHKRDWKNQIKRFQLLKYLKPVLEGMKYYQEYSEELKRVKVKREKKILWENKLVKYWAFVCVIETKIRVKFILKKVGDGNIIFWSAIPFWQTKEYKDIKYALLHKGNLEED